MRFHSPARAVDDDLVLIDAALQRQAMYDNPWLRSGHRAYELNSYLDCITSLFYPHNDLLNVYTHLAGSIYFVYEGVTAFLRIGPQGGTMYDKLVFLTYALLVSNSISVPTDPCRLHSASS